MVALASGHHTSTALAGATTAPPTRAFPRVTIAHPFGRLGAGPGRRRRVDTARARRRPGYLFGHGPIDADLARDLAADGTWKRGAHPHRRDAFGSHQRQPVRQARSSVSAPHFRRREAPADVAVRLRERTYRLAASLRRPCGSGTAGVVSRTAPSKPVSAI
ncbi:hypothetical protein GS498_24165 [Rhodococcus hoagii]|nr:hypothetical protein [Prescottella equi]